MMEFTLANSYLNSTAVKLGYEGSLVLNGVYVLGVQTAVTQVFVNEKSTPFSYDTASKVSENLLVTCYISHEIV